MTRLKLYWRPLLPRRLPGLNPWRCCTILGRTLLESTVRARATNRTWTIYNRTLHRTFRWRGGASRSRPWNLLENRTFFPKECLRFTRNTVHCHFIDISGFNNICLTWHTSITRNSHIKVGSGAVSPINSTISFSLDEPSEPKQQWRI